MTPAPGRVAALDMRGVSKRFGATQALDAADLMVRAGTVHVLLGENGAGKSTLMHIASGVLAPDTGSVAVNGSTSATHGAPRPGIGMVHQHLSLVPAMTAAENFELGGMGLLRLAEARDRLNALSRASGLFVPADVPVRELSLVLQQRVEILKALGRDASLLIMDEPTAMLAPAEVSDLLEWVRRFVTGGASVVLVTHKLREALAVADDITVLRRGRTIWSGPAAGTSESQLAGAIFPDSAPETATAVPHGGQGGAVCVQARDLTLRSSHGGVGVHRASFGILRGEILGVAAVEGAGHRELLAALAGFLRPENGSLILPEAIAFIPADRRADALIPELSITENVALRGLGSRRGRMPWPELRTRARALIERFAITAPSPDARAAALSGGNQQRLVVARELEHAVDLVVADNPTRGLDVRATTFVHEQLRAAARAGAAVVVHSSDLDEVLSLATRIVVVFNGTIASVPMQRDEVGRAMLGAA